MRNIENGNNIRFCKYCTTRLIDYIDDNTGWERQKRQDYYIACIFHMFFIETKGTFQDYDYPVSTNAKAIVDFSGKIEIVDADKLTFIDEQEYKNLKNA